MPHSEIIGSKPTPGSPMLIAGCHVFHRLYTPRHSPDALLILESMSIIRRIKNPAYCLIFRSGKNQRFSKIYKSKSQYDLKSQTLCSKLNFQRYNNDMCWRHISLEDNLNLFTMLKSRAISEETAIHLKDGMLFFLRD